MSDDITPPWSAPGNADPTGPPQPPTAHGAPPPPAAHPPPHAPPPNPPGGYVPPPPGAAPAPPGWWLASDGNWYPPQAVAYGPGQRTNGMAIASMVLGILWIYWIGSVLALIFGYIGRRQIDESRGVQGGRGMATAGIVLGWIGVGIFGVFIFFALIAAAGA